ncbi:hypothetical protein K1T71_008633 [Dendrolimus kikuchii]|uniref:Uncharacterized protein n=1 Tax=Dendrolimus kikuchii TaxID=765133 RepID=A0ACC1CUY4_9NEOP|nr:hypothetical protein K1T71_008633 [Dendrolimus kikuchii]
METSKEIADLTKKRSSFKGRMDLFSKFLGSLDSTSLTSNVISELELRIGKLELLYARYDETQSRLECLSDLETQITEREVFESICVPPPASPSVRHIPIVGAARSGGKRKPYYEFNLAEVWKGHHSKDTRQCNQRMNKYELIGKGVLEECVKFLIHVSVLSNIASCLQDYIIKTGFEEIVEQFERYNKFQISLFEEEVASCQLQFSSPITSPYYWRVFQPPVPNTMRL